MADRVWKSVPAGLKKPTSEGYGPFPGGREDGGDAECHLAAGVARRR